MVQRAIAGDLAVQDREQRQRPTVVEGLGPAFENFGVGHIFFEIEAVLRGDAAKEVQQGILIRGDHRTDRHLGTVRREIHCRVPWDWVDRGRRHRLVSPSR